MSYSDDYPSPAAPFTGGLKSDIFDNDDFVGLSPTTTERVVDTESGFLVVVKTVEGRFALSVKRRLGTPPTTSILLTAEESSKLADILKFGPDADLAPASTVSLKGKVSRKVDRWLEHIDAPPLDDASDLADAKSEQRGRKFKWTIKTTIVTAIVAGIAFGFAAVKLVQSPKAPPSSAPLAAPVAVKPAANPIIDPLAEPTVDKFSRQFVANMLDFNPDTYRVSQVQAMASMTPKLLGKYWVETNFPISLEQLKSLPKNQTVLITKVDQERDGTSTTAVDVYAELVSDHNKISTPLHLKLKLGLNESNQLCVVDQRDLTASQ